MTVKSGIPAFMLAMLVAAVPSRAGNSADRGVPGSVISQVPAETHSLMAEAAPSGMPATEYLALGRQDYYWASASLLASISAHFRYQGMPPVDTAALDRRHLWPTDRWLAGRYSPGADLASDLIIFPLGALPMALTAWDARTGEHSWNAAVADAVIYAEAIILSSSLDLMVRSLRIHPRPLVYGSGVPAGKRLSGEASGSFYSGHANGAFLAAVYFSYTYGLRHPESEYLGWIWAGSLGAATAVAGLRMAAGKHFPSDVVAGAAAGAFFGWAFPRMHKAGRDGEAVGMSVGWDHLGLHPRISFRF